MTVLFSDYEGTNTNHQTLNKGHRTSVSYAQLQEIAAGGAGKPSYSHI